MNKIIKALKYTTLAIMAGGWIVLVFVYLAISGVYLLIK